VLDSPFSSLETLSKDLIDQKSPLPAITTDYFYEHIKEKVLENADFDMSKVAPVKYLKNC
jgi:hypothetical protein